MTQGRISAYERGIKKPEARTVMLLAQALGADPAEALDALMWDTPGMENSRDAGKTDDRAEGIRALGQLTEEEYQTLVLPLLRKFVKDSPSE